MHKIISSSKYKFAIDNTITNYIIDNYTTDGISKKIYENNIWDPIHIKICTDFINKYVNMVDKCILDIGANLGGWTVEIAKNFKDNKVYSFEPQEKKYYQLCGNIFINKLDNVTAHRYALTDNPNIEELVFLIDNHNNGGSRLECEYQRAPTIVPHISVNVPTKTLDKMKIENVGFIKIDVEGHEYSVLKGGIELIKKSNYPPIAFESWDDDYLKNIQIELKQFLFSLGYICVRLGNSEYIAIHKTQFKDDMLDILHYSDEIPTIES